MKSDNLHPLKTTPWILVLARVFEKVDVVKKALRHQSIEPKLRKTWQLKVPDE